MQGQKFIDASKVFREKMVIKQVNRNDLLNVDDKNWQSIVCRRCDSLIFPEDRVKYIEGIDRVHLLY
ncbi:unnamed protein product [Nippostrongylus brasiliensis]|uniref:DUF951 domain-containing protein n=1 Tax=Nippostrongylus brasiliensis TaxID=27835 RepID=A0A0N4YZ82_NIPBR|nr:unnamed protein product [Nippostrongylus brasiliensis]